MHLLSVSTFAPRSAPLYDIKLSSFRELPLKKEVLSCHHLPVELRNSVLYSIALEGERFGTAISILFCVERFYL